MEPATDASDNLVGLGADVAWPGGDDATDVDADTDAPRAGFDPSQGRLAELASWWRSVAGATAPQRPRIVVLGEQRAAVEVAELAGAGIHTVRDDVASEPSIASGIALTDAEVDSGTDLLVLVVPDTDVAALTVVSVLTNTEPVKVMPRGTTLEPTAWMAQASAVRDARRIGYEHRDEPGALAKAIGAPSLECATAIVLRAAGRRTPLLLDGIGAVAAGLLAAAVSPRASRWWQVADRNRHPAVDIATAKLGQRPILDLGIGTADGTAGALALLVLRAATMSRATG